MKVKYATFQDIQNGLLDYEDGTVYVVKDETPDLPRKPITVTNSQPTESVEVKTINTVVRPATAVVPVEGADDNNLFLSGNQVFVSTSEGVTPLNSEIIDRQDEDRWLVRFGLYKKRVVLFSKADRNDNISSISPPIITQIKMNLESGEIANVLYTDDTLWEKSSGEVSLANNEVLISSSFVFSSENVNIDFNFGVNGVLGDTPSKVFNNFRQKYDLILFKEVDEGAVPTDRPGPLLYDFPTSQLIFLEANALNDWSTTYIEPTEGKETYAIAVALTSNVVPSIIDADSPQWTPPVLADPRARDGEQGPPGEPGDDGLDAASVRIITSSAGFKKRNNVFIPETITLSFSTENISSITSTIWQKNGLQAGTNNTLVITGSTDFASVETNIYKIIVTGTINGIENSSREAEIILNRFDEEPGAPGADAASVVITTSAASFRRDRSETVTPSSIILGTTVNNITGTPNLQYVWKKGNDTVGNNSEYSVPSTDFSGTTTTNTYSVEVTGIINGQTASRTANIVINRLDDGPIGPTAVFKGTYNPEDTNAKYTRTNSQKDVVFYIDNYFILKDSADEGTLTRDTPPGNDWEAFAFFQYIASELSITEESIVRNNISIGDNAEIIISSTPNDPPFLSIGQGNQLGYDEDGIFLGMNKPDPQSSAIPMLSLKGGQEENFLIWNGQSLDIRGDLRISEDVTYYKIQYENTAGLKLNVFELVESNGSLDNIEFEYKNWSYDSTEEPPPLSSLNGINVEITKGLETEERRIPISLLGGATIAILSTTLTVESFNLGFSYSPLTADFNFLDDNVIGKKDKIIEETEFNVKNIFDFLISERTSGATNPGGLNTHVQFNNNFAFGGSSNFTWNNSTNALTIGGSLILGSQANKATIQYTTNQARTYTIPDSGANANFVMTQGAQTIAGVKQFNSRIDASGISTTATTLNSTPNSILVFANDPSGTRRLIQTRTRAQILSDILAASEDHVHGNISTAGTITTDTNVSSGHKIATIDGDNKVSRSNLAFGSSDSQFLRNDGTWNEVSILNVSGVTNAGASIVGITPSLTLGDYFLRLTRAGANTFTSTWRTPAQVRTDIGAGTSNLALGETQTTAHRGDHGKAAYDHSQVTTGAVHGATTVGNALFRISNNSTSIKFIRVNTNNTLTYRTGAEVRSDIGAGTSNLALGETQTTAHRGDHGKAAYDHSQVTTGAVHGATTVGNALFRITDNATNIKFIRVNANNTLSYRTGAETRSDIGAAPAFTNQNANIVFAGPASGNAAAPSFRALVAADIPTLNQDTTGTAANVTGVVAIANGGTGTTTAANARINLGATETGSSIFTIPNPTINGNFFLRVERSEPFGGNFLYSTVFRTPTQVRTEIGAAPAFTNQNANVIFAGPASGNAAAPSFRALVAADIPNIGLSAFLTGNLTLNAGHRNTMIRMNNTINRTVTVPLNIFQAGDEVHIVRNNTGEVTINPATNFTLHSEGNKRRINLRYQVATVKFYSPTEALLFGALKT